MEPIDTAYNRFSVICQEMQSDEYWPSIVTEADTRLKIIDRFFVEILGWLHGEIHCEEAAGNNYIDYKLSIDGSTKMIIEAKKTSRDFGFGLFGEGRFYKLNGTLMKNKDLREGFDQAIRYAAYKGAELACVTNGFQWVVFLTRLSQEGKDIDDGYACVFNGLDQIKNNFKEYYCLLARDEVRKYSFRHEFYKQDKVPPRFSNTASFITLPKHRELMAQDQIHKDIDKLLQAFFQDIIDETDEKMLVDCFVTSKDSDHAEIELLRLSEDLVNSVQYIDSDGKGLVEKVEKFSIGMNGNEESQKPDRKKGEIVLLAGIKGAGKSTFIKRFFKVVLPAQMESKFEFFTLDLAKFGDNPENIVNWINSQLIDMLDDRPSQKGAEAYNYMLGCFYGEYVRLSETTMKTLYEKDKDAFKIEFERKIEEFRISRPSFYISKILNRIYLSEKKVPCVVFDNADHFPLSVQNSVFQNAVALSKNCSSLIILPITDKTSWHVADQSALQSYYTDSFYLPVPDLIQIFQKRLSYILRKTEQAKAAESHGFLANGIRFEVGSVTQMVSGLKKLLLQDRMISDWLFGLTNGNIRECLILARETLSSPHLSLAKMYSEGILSDRKNASSDKKDVYYEIKKSMICSRYDRYPGGDQSKVKNVFNITRTDDEMPFMCTRMLHHMNSADTEKNHGFMVVDDIVKYFKEIGANEKELTLLLNAMLQQGLCLSHDPTQISIENINRVKISPSGKLHLQWSISDATYIEEMVKVTPFLDPIAYSRIKSYLDIVPKGARTTYPIKVFRDYVFKEDAHKIHLPSDDEFVSQIKIIKYFQSECINTNFLDHEGVIIRIGPNEEWCILKRQTENKETVFLHRKNLLPHSSKIFSQGKNVHFEQISFDKKNRPFALFAEILE